MMKKLANENGYLLVSTLFFLLFSGLFAQSAFQIASNQVIQLQQLTNSYQARTALNMSETILRNELENESIPLNGKVVTSLGDVFITKVEANENLEYELTMTLANGASYTKTTMVETDEETPVDEEETEEVETIIHQES